MSTQDWVSVICNTVEKVVVGQSWQRAFLQDGVLLQQQFLSEEACASLGWKGLPLAGNGPPQQMMLSVSCLVVLVQGS